MKVCPVCSETFADDLKFCDLDGARLARQTEGGQPVGHSKVWSLLGIGLLVGALVISAVSVFLIPKSRPAATTASTESQPYAPANKTATPDASSAATNPADNSSAAAPADQPEVVAEGLPPDPKKKDKAKVLTDDGTGTKLNPKAAAQSGEEEVKPAPTKAETVIVIPPPKKVEPAVTVKSVSETRETEVASKPTTAEPKKDTRNAKDADKKKNDDKDKKKGGFFRVFKKIFGKD
jgi:hypothetical protein